MISAHRFSPPYYTNEYLKYNNIYMLQNMLYIKIFLKFKSPLDKNVKQFEAKRLGVSYKSLTRNLLFFHVVEMTS